jgi:hypothetical protein
MSGPIYHPDIVQGTPEWDAIRAGKWSASKGAVIMGGLDTQGLKDYILDLAWGRVFGPPDSGFKSKAMERGHLVEPESRDWFAFTRDVVVEEMGFVEHRRIPHLGWSPDGLFESRRRAIEAKCPLHKAWMMVQETGKVPAEYRWQTKFACFIGELDGLDFVAYHPLAGGLVVPVEITDSEKDQIEARIALLEPKVLDRVARLMEHKAAA